MSEETTDASFQEPPEAIALEIEDEHLLWWHRALLASATGLCVSLLLALLVTIGLGLRLTPIVTLERVGIEEGMRIYWAFGGFIPPPSAVGPAFLFLDIDPIACARYRGPSRALCRTEPIVTAALGADAISWARKSGARGIVLDVAPFADAVDRTIVRMAAVQPGPWVIAPLAGRFDVQGGSTVFNHDSASDLIPFKSQGSVRLAVFDSGIGASEGDETMLRHFRDAIPIREPWENGQPYRLVPTAGRLAAELFHDGVSLQKDCRVHASICTTRSSLNDLYYSERLDRIAFSIPSLAVSRPAEQEARLSARYDAVYTRLVASKLLEAGSGRFVPQPDSVGGRIVVIGSSAAVSQDWTMTPIGPMSGSEYLINAIRSIALGERDLKRDGGASLLTKFGEKAATSVRGASIMTLTWLAIFALLARGRGQGRLARLVRGFIVVMIFIIGLTVVGVVELSFLAAEAGEGMFKGRFVDILTPVLALGLEGYTEAAVKLLRWIENRLEKLISLIRRTVVGLHRDLIGRSAADA